MSVDLKRFPGLPEHALTMKNLADAHRLRTHVISCLEMADVATDAELKQQLLTFVVVGAGFSGVETVAEVNELIHRALKYYPNIEQDEIRVHLVEYANRILPTFPADLAEYATRRLKMHGIEVQDRRRHQGGDEHRGGADRRQRHSRRAPSSPPSATVPIRSWRRLGLDMHWGRIKTDRCMRVSGHDGVWALGRCRGHSPGRAPGGGTVRLRAADRAVRRARRAPARRQPHRPRRTGRPLKPFAYTSKGSLASLGMSKAVAEVYGVKLSGTLAWLLWRGFYLSFLPGFATKLRVLVNWVLNLFVPPNIVLIESSQPGTRYIHYRKGDKVLEPGMLIDGFYTVVKGALKLTIDNPETGEHFEKVFGPGDHFGERVLVKSALRTGLVVALEDSVVLWISQKDFTRLAAGLPVPRQLFQGLYRAAPSAAPTSPSRPAAPSTPSPSSRPRLP